MKNKSPKLALFEQFAEVAKTLGSAHRLDLLEHVAQGERSVGLICGGGISQTLATEPDMKYEIRFNMAGDPTATPALKTVVVSFGETRVFTFDTTGRSHTEMGWAPRTWVFRAKDSKTTLTFSSPKAECSAPAIDSVRIEAVEIGVRNDPADVKLAQRDAGED